MAGLSVLFGVVFSPLGIVFGHVAKGQIKRSGDGGVGLESAGIATTGLVISYIFLGCFVLGIGLLGIALAVFRQ